MLLGREVRNPKQNELPVSAASLDTNCGADSIRVCFWTRHRPPHSIPAHLLDKNILTASLFMAITSENITNGNTEDRWSTSRELEKLTNKGEKQKYIHDWIAAETSAEHIDSLFVVAEYALANKFYAEAMQLLAKTTDSADIATLRKVHSSLNGFLYSTKNNVLKNVPKDDLADVPKLYVKLSHQYNRNHFFLESFQALEDAAEIVNFTKTFPKKMYSLCYFKLLAKFFARGNMFFSFLNALTRLVMLNSRFKSQLTHPEFCAFLDNVFRIVEIKNEGGLFQSLFGRLSMQSVKEMKSILSSVKYEQGVRPDEEHIETLREACFLELEMDDHWCTVLRGVCGDIECSGADLPAFLRKNNIDFKVQDGWIKIGSYKHRSMTRNVFLLKEGLMKAPVAVMREKDVERRKAFDKMQKKNVLDKAEVSRKLETKRPTVVAKKDYFTRGYNLFRLYARERTKSAADVADDYKTRIAQHRSEFEAFKEREVSAQSRALGIKDAVIDAAERLEAQIEKRADERRKIEDAERERLRQVQDCSWRDRAVDSMHVPRSTTTKPAPFSTFGTRSVAARRDDANFYMPPIVESLSRMSLGPSSEKAADLTPKEASKSREGLYKPPARSYLPDAGADGKEPKDDKASGEACIKKSNSSNWR